MSFFQARLGQFHRTREEVAPATANLPRFARVICRQTNVFPICRMQREFPDIVRTGTRTPGRLFEITPRIASREDSARASSSYRTPRPAGSAEPRLVSSNSLASSLSSHR